MEIKKRHGNKKKNEESKKAEKTMKIARPE